MKRNIIIIITCCLLTGCDYFANIDYKVDNITGEEVKLVIYRQYQSLEDVLPTYEHGEDYNSIKISNKDTTIVLKNNDEYKETFDVGIVGMHFNIDDNPEALGSIPLWKRIKHIIIGNDTLPANTYSKEKWTYQDGMNATYKLLLTNSSE